MKNYHAEYAVILKNERYNFVRLHLCRFTFPLIRDVDVFTVGVTSHVRYDDL